MPGGAKRQSSILKPTCRRRPADEQNLTRRFFLVLAALTEGDAGAAGMALDDIAAFQKAQLANDTNAALSVQLLNYRLLAMKADKARGADKSTANDAAVPY